MNANKCVASGTVPIATSKGEKIKMKNKRIIIATVVILLVIIFVFIFKDKVLKMIYPKDYQDIITVYANKYNVEDNLIFALIKAESNFDENAVSHKNAIRINADYGRNSR